MQQRKPKPLDAEGLWQYGLRALGGRAHSISELKTKLRRRAADPALVDEAVAKFKEYGYLNDQTFAANYAARRLENEGFGRMRVMKDLLNRRVASPVASKAVDHTFRDTSETQLIETFLRRKFKRLALGEYLLEPKHLASVYRRLRTAGFSSGSSVEVLKRYAKQAELLEDIASGEEPPE